MTVQELLDDLQHIDDEAAALVAPLTDAQANWQPEGGRRWSTTQNLLHLARTNEVYVESMREGLRRAAPGTAPADLWEVPGWFGRWFIRNMEPPPRFRVKTRAVVQPPSTGAVREALTGFLASQEAVRAFAREAAGRDLRARFTSPFGPLRFRLATGLLVLAAHDRRHLWQARQVVADPAFPR